MVRPMRDELQLAAVVAEVRNATERRRVPRIVALVASAVDQQGVELQTLRMGEQHDADGEHAEAEFVAGGHDRPGPTGRLASMADAELRRNDENVALLLGAELLPHRGRLG